MTKAKRGAAFLDEKLGRGWRRKIRRRELNIDSPCNCIIGQLYDHNFLKGLVELGIRSDRTLMRLGFGGEAGLTEAWLEVLRGKA